MSTLVLQLSRVGFLILLWLFVLAAIRVLRADLRTADSRIVPRRRTQNRPVATPPRGVPGGGGGTGLIPTMLVVTAGALAGTRLRLGGGPILLGRAEDSTLVLDDDYASTRHARIVQQGQNYVVEDLGSTNGTFLAGSPVHEPTPIPVGTPVRVGQTVIELQR